MLKFCSWAVLLILCVGFSSCLKDDEEENDDLSNFRKGIVGTWKYDAYYFGNGGWETVNSTKTITFNADGSCAVNSWKSYIVGESTLFSSYWYTAGYYVRFDPTDQTVNYDTYHWTVALIAKDTMRVDPKPNFDGHDFFSRYVRVK